MEDVPYLMRGINPVDTESSMLTSSSKFLNNLKLREWAPFILFRQVGADYPPPAEMYGMSRTLDSLRDLDRMEEAIHAERKINPKFDAWFNEGHVSNFTIEDFKDYPKGSVGGIFYDWITEGNYEINIIPPIQPKTQLEYYNLRSGQTHDFEHIITGGEFNFVGELVPYWMRLTNPHKHINDQWLAGELTQIHLLGQLRYTIRTGLHYPQIWKYCVDAIQRGITVGQQSEAIFMFKFEDVFHLPLAEARKVLGVRGAVNRDTMLPGQVLSGKMAPEDFPAAEREWMARLSQDAA